jgi:ribosome-associated toxin RatA of RatAB toxin-antitoxin module
LEHEHTEHVAAAPDRVYAALADVNNLPHYVPQVTAARRGEGDHVQIEARYEGKTQHGEAWFRADADARRIEWGAEGSPYHGSLEVAGTLEAIRRLV